MGRRVKKDPDEWLFAILKDHMPVQLRSVDSKSLMVHIHLFPAQNNITIPALIDSGCSGHAFIDRNFTLTTGISTFPLPQPREIRLADGAVSDFITQFAVIPISMSGHKENCLFFVTNLAQNTPAILGLPWLQLHNPSVNWEDMSLTFDKNGCRSHCEQGKPVKAHALIENLRFTSPPPPSPPPPPSNYQSPSVQDSEEEEDKEDKPVQPTQYQAPSVEDCEEKEEEVSQPLGADLDLFIPPELTPGRPHYRTHNTASANGGEEVRARMIPNRNTKPAPALKVNGQRQQKRKPPQQQPLPPLSVPIPSAQITTPDLMVSEDDIKLTVATSFLQFCKQPGVVSAKITWAELDKATAQEHLTPDTMPENAFYSLLKGEGSPDKWKEMLPERVHSFVDECFTPLHLRRISEEDIEKFLKVKPELTAPEIVSKLPVWLRDLYEAFLPGEANKLPPRRTWDHKIDLTPGYEPPYQKNRPFSPQELRVIRKWLDDNLTKGFIRESRSRSAAPLLLAAKPGGGVRICQDYRGLNNVTIKNRYPLPLIRETLDALCGAKVYTKLDIIAAFNKLRIAEGHEWKTAFITRFGLYESLVMPFGLCNAPASFQNYINHTLHDLLDRICTAYLDDVLVFSKTKHEHRGHVREVVQRLHEAGLQIDIGKCEFEVTSTKYLGIIVTPTGIEMDPEKVRTITQWLPPPTLKDLQRFIGFANFYRRFIKGFSSICKPLNDLMRKDKLWEWGQEQQQAFDTLKQAFSSSPVLVTYDYTKKTVLETDASDWACGGVLSQYDNEGILRPVAYFSSRHSPTECNYEIYDKELLAIIKALEEWRPEVQGTEEPTEILTDHKNLQTFTTTKMLSQRQVRWSEFLSQFNFRITYRPGAKAIRPDALSRKPGDKPDKEDISDERIRNRQRVLLPTTLFDPAALEDMMGDSELTAAPIELITPAYGQPMDEVVQKAYNNNDTAQQLIEAVQDPTVTKWPKAFRKYMRVPMVDCSVKEGKLYFRDRMYAPQEDELRAQILYRHHSAGPAGHPGRVKTLDLITRTWWWPRMSRDVETYVQACDLCVRTKASRLAPQGFLQPLPVPYKAWSDISVDYITPLPESNWYGRSYKHLLIVVCRLTKMRHLIPVSGLTAAELADAFVARVYCLHGCPDNIVSDRGTQFISQFWTQLSLRLGITLKHSSSFHPETDGQTERINSSVEAYLRDNRSITLLCQLRFQSSTGN
jgi:hypothetical protein